MFMTFASFALLYNAMREALGIAKGTKIRMWSSKSTRIVQSEPSKPAPAAGVTHQADEDLFHYFFFFLQEPPLCHFTRLGKTISFGAPYNQFPAKLA